MTDSSFTIPKHEIASEYRRWQSTVKREPHSKRATVFRTRVQQRLSLLGSDDSADQLPGSKSTWYDWAQLGSGSVQLSYDLCHALCLVIGKDLTPGQDFRDTNDSTRVVTIYGKPHAKIISNAPNEDGHECHLVSVDRIAFRKSDPMRLPKSAFGSTGKTGEIDAGSVVYGLARAVIKLSADGDVVPIVNLLNPRNDPNKAKNIELSDDPQRPGCWTVDPCDGEGSVIVGDVYLEQLATAWHRRNSEMDITIEANPDWIEVDFRPSGEIANTDKAKSDARKHLIDKVLRLALSDGEKSLIFSQAPVKEGETP